MYKFQRLIIVIAFFVLVAGCSSTYPLTSSTASVAPTVPTVPAVPAVPTVPPENEAMATVAKVEKKPLEGLSICIDAGHGSTTRAKGQKEPMAPGSQSLKAAFATGTTGISTKISEASLNLTVSLKLKKAFSQKGAETIMVRETGNCDLSNVERAKRWNNSGADFTIRIHANGAGDSKTKGILMMVPSKKYIKDQDLLETSLKLGKNILEGVIENTKARSMGVVETSELTGFNWSTIPVVLIEMGFMTNPEEDRLLNTDAYQNKIVDGIVDGVEKYFTP